MTSAVVGGGCVPVNGIEALLMRDPVTRVHDRLGSVKLRNMICLGVVECGDGEPGS